MEYFGTCLLSPLQSGVTYTLTMDVNAAADLKAWNDRSSGGDTNGDTVLLCVESCSSLPVPSPGNGGYLGEDGYAEYAKAKGWPALPGLPLQQGFPVLATASPGGGLEAGCGRVTNDEPCAPGHGWKAVTFSFTPAVECAALILGPAKTQTKPTGRVGSYVIYDAVNLQRGSAGACNAEGECVPTP